MNILASLNQPKKNKQIPAQIQILKMHLFEWKEASTRELKQLSGL